METETKLQTTTEQKTALVVHEESQVKKELGLTVDIDVQKIDPALEKKADAFLKRLLDKDTNKTLKRRAVDEMGLKTQTEIYNLSKMLDEPIKAFARTGDDGGPVAKSLLDLKEQVEELDPVNFDFSSPSGFFSSFTRILPWVGPKLSRYFAKYMTAEAVINTIIKSLEMGRDKLKRDNITLSYD